MQLFIAEKPSMGRDIAAALGGRQTKKDGYIEIDGGAKAVTWCFGHMLEAKDPDQIEARYKAWRMADLPILPSPLPLEPIAKSKGQLRVIKELALKATEIVGCGDAGREGELLVREILDFYKIKKPLKRLWVNDTTLKGYQDALSRLQPGAKYDGLYDSAKGRQMGDWWVGMNLSRAWTLASDGADGVEGVVSVGRIQTPTMCLVVKRDLEIEHFKASAYYELEATFAHSVVRFATLWEPSENVPVDSEGRVIDKALVDSLAGKLKGKPAKVSLSEAKSKKEAAPLPFHLGGIQAKANAMFGFSVAYTLEVVQKLYEEHKLLTYPRTECQFLPDNMHGDGPGILAAIAATCPDLATVARKANPRLKHAAFNDAKVVEHHGLVPTSTHGSVARLSADERKVYELVAKSFIALFHPDHEYKAVALEVECMGERFRATGKKPTLAGWKEVYGKGGVAEDEDESPVLPELPLGAPLACADAKALAKETKPPARFTEGALLTAMENVHRFIPDTEEGRRIKKVLKETSGLGTSATRAAAIERIIQVGFVARKGKLLISSNKARAVFKVLPEPLREPGLTALFEQELEKVKDGESTLSKFLALQEKFVREQVVLAQKAALPAASGPACPVCAKGSLRRRKSKAGAYFWSCSESTWDAATKTAGGCKAFFWDEAGKPDLSGKSRSPSTGTASAGKRSAPKGGRK